MRFLISGFLIFEFDLDHHRSIISDLTSTARYGRSIFCRAGQRGAVDVETPNLKSEIFISNLKFEIPNPPALIRYSINFAKKVLDDIPPTERLESGETQSKGGTSQRSNSYIN